MNDETPKFLLAMGIVCYLFFGFSLWAAWDAYQNQDESGYVRAGRFNGGRYPWHFFLSCPVVSFAAGTFCVYKAWRIWHE